MLHIDLRPEFKARAASLFEPLSRKVEKASPELFAGFRALLVGGVGGWAAVVVAGAALMASDPREKCCTRVEAPAPVATASTAAAPPAPHADAPLALSPAAPAPVVAPAKSTQRVDMAPIAAIPSELPPKTKHKVHKRVKVREPNG